MTQSLKNTMASFHLRKRAHGGREGTLWENSHAQCLDGSQVLIRTSLQTHQTHKETSAQAVGGGTTATGSWHTPTALGTLPLTPRKTENIGRSFCILQSLHIQNAARQWEDTQVVAVLLFWQVKNTSQGKSMWTPVRCHLSPEVQLQEGGLLQADWGKAPRGTGQGRSTESWGKGLRQITPTSMR